MSRAYSDHHIRQMLTASQAELLAEYERCTKRTVTLDYIRLSALATLELRDVTVDDVFTVIKYVRKRIRAGDNRRRVGTFTPASLEFGNLFSDYAKFEDRLQTARAEMADKRIVKGKLVPHIQSLGNGETITRLDDRGPRESKPIREALADALMALAKTVQTDD